MSGKNKSSGQFDWVNGGKGKPGTADEQKTVKTKRELPAFSLAQLFPRQEPYPILDNGVLILVSGLLYLFLANGFGRIASSIFLAIVCCSFVWRPRKRAFGLLAVIFLADLLQIIFVSVIMHLPMGAQSLPGLLLNWIVLTAAFLLPGILPVPERIKPWCSLAVVAIWKEGGLIASMASMAAYAPEKSKIASLIRLESITLIVAGVVIFLITRKKLPAKTQAEFEETFEETKKVTEKKAKELLGAGAGLVSMVTEKAGDAAKKASESARELEKKYKEKGQDEEVSGSVESEKRDERTEETPGKFCPVCGHPLEGTEIRCPGCNQPVDFQ